jgi:hypothetical protein
MLEHRRAHETRPGLAAAAVSMARILDTAGAVTTHPSATRQLKMVLDELRKARGGQRGKLPSVQTMAASSRKRSPEARVNPRTSRRVNLWRISDRGCVSVLPG